MSATYDEPLHAASAWVEWRHGDYRINPEDPPLSKYWAVFPLASDALTIDRDMPAWREMGRELSATRWAWCVDMLFWRGNDADAYLTRAREMMLILGVAMGAVIAWFAHRLAGAPAAIVATALLAFDPGFLGHAPLVKNDVAIALVTIGLVMAIWSFGRRGTWKNALVVMLLCGAGFVTKFSGVLLAPVLVLSLIVRALLPLDWIVLGRSVQSRRGRLLAAGAMSLASALATVFIIWATYGFRFDATPDGAVIDQAPLLEKLKYKTLQVRLGRQPTLIEVADADPPLVGRVVSWATRQELLPQAWLTGFLYTYDSSILRRSFLLGEFSVTGWWYYFPLAMLFKTPLATLVLLAMSAGLLGWIIRRRGGPWLRANAWTLTCFIVPFAIFLFFAMSSNLNLGLRHVFPLYPFLFIAAGCAAAWAWAHLAGRAVVGTLLLALAVESLAAFPNYIAFFHVAAGGPRGGIRLLSDSNLDWGQGLKHLAEWQRENPSKPLYLAYFGTADPAYYGIRYTNLPGGYSFGEPPRWPDGPAVLAVSATILQGTYAFSDELRASYQALQSQPVLEVVGETIYLYEVK